MTGRRERIFTLAAWSIPVIFFVLLEAALALAGYGGREPLFVEFEPDPRYLQPNDAVIERFFAAPDQAPAVSIDTTYFLRDKPDDLFRVVVQGGSSAAGFPYGRWASPAGMLERRLIDSHPDRRIEVVSTAMSAVNSYTLLDFADEIIAQQPDVVVIYAGHNEYLGVLGVGSAMAGGGSRLVKRMTLALRRWRTMQLVQRVVAGARGDVSDEARSGTLMARIAGERAITYGSVLFDAGVEQIRANVSDLLDRYERAGIPVIIGTLASNDRHQPPFANVLSADVDADRWQVVREAAEAAVDARSDDAAREVAALLALDDTSADAWFLEARRRDGDGLPAAAEAYRAARDRDGLRFRAPSAINAVIGKLADRHADVHLAPVAAALADESPGGVVGDELMVEHLHPNLRGYFLLADAYATSLVDSGLLPPAPAGMTREAAWQRQPLSEVEQLGGAYRIARLKGDWPFTDTKIDVALPAPANEIERIAQAWFREEMTWVDAMNQSLVAYQRGGNYTEAARVAQNIAAAFPFEANPRFVAGQMLIRAGRKADALRQFHAAASMAPRRAEYLIALSQAFYANDQRANARRTLEQLLAAQPDHPRARQMLQFLESQPAD